MAIETARRDPNYVTTLMAADMTTGLVPTKVYADETTHRLLVSAVITSGSFSISSGGVTNFATSQVALSTTASLIVAARATRASVTIVNLSTTDIYLGGSGVTTSNGQLLLGTKGTAVTISAVGDVYGIVASGTPSVSYEEEYN